MIHPAGNYNVAIEKVYNAWITSLFKWICFYGNFDSAWLKGRVFLKHERAARQEHFIVPVKVSIKMICYLHSHHVLAADAFVRVRDLLQCIALRLEYYVLEIFRVRHYKVERVLAHLFKHSLYSTHGYVVEKSIKPL